jgi:anti-sigma B factor antagonist
MYSTACRGLIPCRALASRVHLDWFSWHATKKEAEMESVALQGRITINNANEMRRTLIGALRPQLQKLTVDLAGVTYMDTSGLATLMETMRIGRQQGTRLVLRGVQNQPRYLLQVTDLDHVFEIEEAATP